MFIGNKILFVLITFFLVSNAQATVFCTVDEQEVVRSAKTAISALDQYNDELDKTLVALRSSVALAMAISIEKERQAADIASMRKIMGLKADASSLLIRKKIVAIDSEIYSLQNSYGESIQQELKNIEEK